MIVSASGGLDSSTTLATLKAAGMNPIACHFRYSHRGQDAEEIAIQKVTEILDIPLYKFDIEQTMKMLDKGMLTDKNSVITTGTEQGLKSTQAWVIYRNHFFLVHMGALAESLIMNEGYDELYLTGGMMQLSESGVYMDNSERFIDSALKFFKFTVTGTKIKALYGLANILKCEQYHLLDRLGYLEVLSPWLVSCDRPIVEDGIPKNCSKGGKPACGSGKLSTWGSQIAGVKDLRNYYEVDDPNYVGF